MSEVNKNSLVEHPQGVCMPDGTYVDLVKIGDNHYFPVTLVDPSGDQQGDDVNPLVITADNIQRPNQASDGLTETITTTAKQLAFSGGDLTIPSGTVSVTIQNGSNNEVYLGKSDVASDGSTTKLGLYNKGNFRTIDVQEGWSIYIVASASSQVNITFEKYA